MIRVGDKVSVLVDGAASRHCHCFTVGDVCEVVVVDESDNSIVVIGPWRGGPVGQWVGMEEVALVK